jgi:hypothetical protein
MARQLQRRSRGCAAAEAGCCFFRHRCIA